jgi:predicted ATPase
LSKNQSLRFTKLALTNWRNFRSVNIALQKRAFFVGPNASGKSNLLDAVRFLSEIARPGSGGLKAAIEDRGGFSSLRCLQARTQPFVEIVAEIGNDTEANRWRYELRINVVNREKFPTVVHERISGPGNVNINRQRSSNDDALEFSQTFMEQVGQNKAFRELAEFLASCRYLHVVPQIVRDRARARLEGEDPYGGDLLRRMKEMPKKTRIPRLRRISDALQIAVPQFRDLELKDDPEGIPHLFASYVHWRPNAFKQSETAFSDGTLRLIGLLWSIAEKGGPLLLEEPELSLNDAIVSELPRMFARMQKLSARQIITTTHSSALLDDSGIGLKEVHRIVVDKNGSSVSSIADEPSIVAQVNSGMTISQAVLPLLRPKSIEELSALDVAS